MEITYKARSYWIERIEQETEEALANRAWFIINLLDLVSGIDRKNTNANLNTTIVARNFDEAVLLSKYWYYIKTYDCRYPKQIMDQIAAAEKLLFV